MSSQLPLFAAVIAGAGAHIIAMAEVLFEGRRQYRRRLAYVANRGRRGGAGTHGIAMAKVGRECGERNRPGRTAVADRSRAYAFGPLFYFLVIRFNARIVNESLMVLAALNDALRNPHSRPI